MMAVAYETADIPMIQGVKQTDEFHMIIKNVL
jgi:hypothetical protein